MRITWRSQRAIHDVGEPGLIQSQENGSESAAHTVCVYSPFSGAPPPAPGHESKGRALRGSMPHSVDFPAAEEALSRAGFARSPDDQVPDGVLE